MHLLAQPGIATVGEQAIYRNAYRLLHDDAPWLFLYHPTYFWGASQQVRTISTTPEGLIRL